VHHAIVHHERVDHAMRARCRHPITGETKTMANRNQGTNQGDAPRSGTSNRGFASMDAAQQREIARMGGEAVSGNREHMAQIGRKGGEASAESRANARSARARPSGEAAATGGAPRDPGSRGYADDGGRGRVQDERSRGGELGVGNRGLNARARSDDEGSRRLGASAASGSEDGERAHGLANRDPGSERNLGARGRDDSATRRNLGGEDASSAGRGMSGRSREADQDDNGASRGNRGNPVGSPRRDRDEDR
jgi:hypothetical protein